MNVFSWWLSEYLVVNPHRTVFESNFQERDLPLGWNLAGNIADTILSWGANMLRLTDLL